MAARLVLFAASAVSFLSDTCLGKPVFSLQSSTASRADQQPLGVLSTDAGRPLTGKFLHITGKLFSNSLLALFQAY